MKWRNTFVLVLNKDKRTDLKNLDPLVSQMIAGFGVGNYRT